MTAEEIRHNRAVFIGLLNSMDIKGTCSGKNSIWCGSSPNDLLGHLLYKLGYRHHASTDVIAGALYHPNGGRIGAPGYNEIERLLCLDPDDLEAIIIEIDASNSTNESIRQKTLNIFAINPV